MYIYERKEWPTFKWDEKLINGLLANVRFSQGMLLGKMSSLGFELQEEAELKTLTSNIIKSSEIEGEQLNPDQVRSSIARHLGLNIAGQVTAPRSIEGIVEMHLDATCNCAIALTEKRLLSWHALLFPAGISGMQIINPGCWRTDSGGPMQVISGGYGHEKIHFQAPAAKRLPIELKQFLAWFNAETDEDFLIRAAIAHLWFVTLHPFEDGNGRIARAIADMMLARSDDRKQRYYSMSTQIQRERKKYYDILEATQKSDLDITQWLAWFLGCLERAIKHSDLIFKNVLNKAEFWERHAQSRLNERQIEILNLLFDGFKGNLTSSKWAKLTKCSQDTASRDIAALLEKHILIKSLESGRSTHYLLKDYPINRGEG